MVNYKKAMEAYIEKEIVVLKKLDLDELNLAMEAITDAFHRDAKIYTMGNGGSAATVNLKFSQTTENIRGVTITHELVYT